MGIFGPFSRMGRGLAGSGVSVDGHENIFKFAKGGEVGDICLPEGIRSQAPKINSLGLKWEYSEKGLARFACLDNFFQFLHRHLEEPLFVALTNLHGLAHESLQLPELLRC